jgi:hypothetical protein
VVFRKNCFDLVARGALDNTGNEGRVAATRLARTGGTDRQCAAIDGDLATKIKGTLIALGRLELDEPKPAGELIAAIPGVCDDPDGGKWTKALEFLANCLAL